MIIAHPAFDTITPDEVAECWNGVLDVPGLYERLWDMTDRYDNSHRANIEDMGPADAIGINRLANFWDMFSDEHRRALNELAAKHDAEIDAMSGF